MNELSSQRNGNPSFVTVLKVARAIGVNSTPSLREWRSNRSFDSAVNSKVIMKIILAISVSASLIFASDPTAAGPSEYFCEIHHIVSFDREGKPKVLQRVPGSPPVARFSVDRDSGLKIGGMFGLFKNQIPTVLAKGNSQNSFIVTWVGPSADNGVHFDFLNVEEFQDGPKKPFVAVGLGEVYSGVCD